MNEQQTNFYLNSLSFGLKDFGATSLKHSNYKTEKYKSIVSENKPDIEPYLMGLSDTVKSELALNWVRMDYLELDKKSHIRMFKTIVNDATFGLSMAFIGELETLNKNEIRIFAIRFYLDNYQKINDTMKTVLIDLVKEYPKKAIVQKLTV